MKLFIGALVALAVSGCATQNAPTQKQASEKPVEQKTAHAVTVSKELQNSEQTSMSCTRQADVRKVELESPASKGCEVWYSSYGNRNKVAWSANGQKHCEGVREKIKSNLENAGYQCSSANRASASDVKNDAK